MEVRISLDHLILPKLEPRYSVYSQPALKAKPFKEVFQHSIYFKKEGGQEEGRREREEIKLNKNGIEKLFSFNFNQETGFVFALFFLGLYINIFHFIITIGIINSIVTEEINFFFNYLKYVIDTQRLYCTLMLRVQYNAIIFIAQNFVLSTQKQTTVYSKVQDLQVNTLYLYM